MFFLFRLSLGKKIYPFCPFSSLMNMLVVHLLMTVWHIYLSACACNMIYDNMFVNLESWTMVGLCSESELS
ncbi:hypothetical protein Hdeb2414_s0001g00028931 [Helianthus debilis subsp. tardiflorus]